MIRPQIDANLIGLGKNASARKYIAYLEAAFRDEHGLWLEEMYRRHRRSPRFAAKCVRRFGRWLIAMRAYAARQQHSHYYIEHLSVTLRIDGCRTPLARIEVTQRTGIAYQEEPSCGCSGNGDQIR